MRKSKSQTGAALDRRLAEETRMLRRPIQAPGLWNRIEKALKAEAETAEHRPAPLPAPAKKFRLTWLLIPAAAGAAFILALAFLPPRPSDPTSGLLGSPGPGPRRRPGKGIHPGHQRPGKASPAQDLRHGSFLDDALSGPPVSHRRPDRQMPGGSRSKPGQRPHPPLTLAALQDKKQTLAEALGT